MYIIKSRKGVRDVIEIRDDVMKFLSDIAVLGTLAGWLYKAIKKLYSIFFRRGKHSRK